MLLRELEPALCLPDARAITPELLRREGIGAVVWDVDGTLMSYHAPAVDPEIRPVLEALIDAGVAQAILSNCGERRFLDLGRIFPELPIVRGYELRGTRTYRVLHRGSDQPGATVVHDLLQQGARPIRKPDGPLLLQVLTALGGVSPTEALMVGDQYLTDVATANLAGVRAAKVPTWKPETFPLPVRASQVLERVAYRFRRGRGRSRSS